MSENNLKDWQDLEADVHVDRIFISRHEMQEYLEGWDTQRVYAPNAIAHGTLRKIISSHTLDKIEIATLMDFISFLFSYHCDHITEKDAWLEFRAQEIGFTLIENNHPLFVNN